MSRPVDPKDLVGTGDIAERLGFTDSTVSNWYQRHRDFPMPVVVLKRGPLFKWPEVEVWFADRVAEERSRLEHKAESVKAELDRISLRLAEISVKGEGVRKEQGGDDG